MVESWEVMTKMTSELESVTADSEFYFVMNQKFYLNHTGGVSRTPHSGSSYL